LGFNELGDDPNIKRKIDKFVTRWYLKNILFLVGYSIFLQYVPRGTFYPSPGILGDY
jgi:hypothetical protein